MLSATFPFLSRSKTLLLSLMLLLWSSTLLLSACGQQTKFYNLGILIDSNIFLTKFDGLKEGLKTLSYNEGKNINFQVLNLAGLSLEQQKTAVKEFAGKNYDAYWTTSDSAASLLKQANSKQPIVVAGGANMTERGLIQSADQPGTNVTGVDNVNINLTLKRMEILLLLAPTIRKVYFVYDTTTQSDTSYMEQIRTKASQLGINLLEKPIAPQQKSLDITSEFKASEASAILMDSTNLFNNNLDLDNLKSVIMREQLLLIGNERFTLEVDAILSYGSPYSSLGHQSAAYVDKVLHGSNPSIMPVSQPDKLELILNQKLADQFGRKFPSKLFDAADEVV